MSDAKWRAVSSQRAWRSGEFSGESDWVTELSEVEIQAFRDAAAKLPANSSDWLNFDLSDLVSEAVSARLVSISDELTKGKGFCLLRGMGAEDAALLRRVFWIIGNGLGEPVMQNTRGEVLSEVFDRFAGQPRDADTRGYESSDELRFHCDGGDCIGLACIRPASVGGASGLVSLLAIFNEILEEAPAHLEVLARGFPLYSRKERDGSQEAAETGKVHEQRIPVFAVRNGYMSAWSNIKLNELVAEVSGWCFTDEESAALRYFEGIAEREEMKLSFMQAPGDILWINNLAVMHRRDNYEDAADPAKRRKLYRMWMNLHDAQPVVPIHAALRQGIPGKRPVIAAD